MLKRKFILNILITTYLLIVSNGCAHVANSDTQPWVAPPLMIKVDKEFKPQKLNLVAVMPLEANPSIYIPKADLEVLTNKWIEALGLYTSLNLLDSADSKQLETTNKSKTPLRSRAIDYGQKLTSQGVLIGIVNDFSHSHNDFNRVSFQVSLIETNSGRTMWTATYEAQNRSLSENLLRVGQAIKHGVNFKTPEQLAQIGFIEAAKKLEEIRN